MSGKIDVESRLETEAKLLKAQLKKSESDKIDIESDKRLLQTEVDFPRQEFTAGQKKDREEVYGLKAELQEEQSSNFWDKLRAPEISKTHEILLMQQLKFESGFQKMCYRRSTNQNYYFSDIFELSV